MILLDTSGLLAALDRDQPDHPECVDAIETTDPPFLLSPFVLAELDHLLAKYAGADAADALLADVADRRYRLEPFGPADIASCRAVLGRFHDLEIGLTDASIAVLAERHDCLTVLTLDRAHFGALRTSGGGAFRIVP